MKCIMMIVLLTGIFLLTPHAFGAPTNAPAATKKNAASPAQPRRSRTPAAVTNQPAATNAPAVTNTAAVAPESQENAVAHHILLAGSFMTEALGILDAFGPGWGGGIGYELHGLLTPDKSRVDDGLYLWLNAAYLVHAPKTNYTSTFGPSDMLVFGAGLGYQFTLPLGPGYSLGLSPFAGYRHYFGGFTLQGTRQEYRRPVISAGLSFPVRLFGWFLLSPMAEYNLILDNSVVHTFNFQIRIGIRI